MITSCEMMPGEYSLHSKYVVIWKSPLKNISACSATAKNIPHLKPLYVATIMAINIGAKSRCDSTYQAVVVVPKCWVAQSGKPK